VTGIACDSPRESDDAVKTYERDASTRRSKKGSALVDQSNGETSGTSSSQHVTPNLERDLSRLVDELASQKNVHHALVAIESLDGSFTWSGASGLVQPACSATSIHTRYWIASVTKLYIAATVFRLIERGDIRLEDSVSSLLPASLIDGIHRLNGADYTDMITVQHLLGHTSGLPDYLEEAPKGEPSLLERVTQQDQTWSSEDAMDIVRSSLTPHFPPQRLDTRNQKIRYSDTNYQLLIEIIQATCGKSLSTAFSELIYQPLGLNETRHPEELKPEETSVAVWFGDHPADVPMAMRSFRDLTSTAQDQFRFMRGLVDGQLFERQTTIYQMMGNWNSFPFSLNPVPTSPGWPIEYGLGAMRFNVPRLFTPIKPIPAIMGHTGVTGSWLFYCPKLKLILAGTVDQLEAPATPFRFLPKLLRTLSDSWR
jgi:D-alanyl-D-alanine carboxypeptidase